MSGNLPVRKIIGGVLGTLTRKIVPRRQEPQPTDNYDFEGSGQRIEEEWEDAQKNILPKGGRERFADNFAQVYQGILDVAAQNLASEEPLCADIGKIRVSAPEGGDEELSVLVETNGNLDPENSFLRFSLGRRLRDYDPHDPGKGVLRAVSLSRYEGDKTRYAMERYSSIGYVDIDSFFYNYQIGRFENRLDLKQVGDRVLTREGNPDTIEAIPELIKHLPHLIAEYFGKLNQKSGKIGASIFGGAASSRTMGSGEGDSTIGCQKGQYGTSLRTRQLEAPGR